MMEGKQDDGGKTNRGKKRIQKFGFIKILLPLQNQNKTPLRSSVGRAADS